MKNENSKHFGNAPIGEAAIGLPRTTSDVHEARRDKLASDIDAFLKKGGEIEQVESGVSGFKLSKHIRFAKEKPRG